MEMTTKEKVIRQSINILEKKIEKVKHLIYYDFFGDVIKVNEEIRNFINNNEFSKQYGSKQFINKLEELKSKLDKVNAAYKKSLNYDRCKLIEEQVKLEFELRDLKMELYFIEFNKDMKQSETSNVF